MVKTELSEKDIYEIKNLLKSSIQKLKDGDFSTWLTWWMKDAYIMPPNHPRVEGHDALLKFIRTFPKVREMSHSDVRIEGREDFAVVTTTLSMRLLSADGKSIEDTGNQMVFFRKQSDGKWLAQAVIFNSDRPETK